MYAKVLAKALIGSLAKYPSFFVVNKACFLTKVYLARAYYVVRSIIPTPHSILSIQEALVGALR